MKKGGVFKIYFIINNVRALKKYSLSNSTVISKTKLFLFKKKLLF